MKFIRCQNCNSYVEKEKAFAEFFCSGECAMQYHKCPVCGRYFPAGESGICSDECRKKYDNMPGVHE